LFGNLSLRPRERLWRICPDSGRNNVAAVFDCFPSNRKGVMMPKVVGESTDK
jgi:hypothetical protein